MSDEKKVIGTIGIDSAGEPEIKEPLFISLAAFRNSKYLDVRKFYQSNGEWLPTKKGVTLHLDQIDELIKILQDKKQEIEAWFNG